MRKTRSTPAGTSKQVNNQKLRLRTGVSQRSKQNRTLASASKGDVISTPSDVPINTAPTDSTSLQNSVLSMINPITFTAHPATSSSQAPLEPAAIVANQTFHLFMCLPSELRESIYELVLVTDKEIVPHLCSGFGNAIKFHDDNSTTHDAIWQRLAITRVSKELRNEALPIFYHNVFGYGLDTLTYLEHLSHTGTFHMVRHVRFPVPFYDDNFAIRCLHNVHRVIEESEEYENALRKGHQNLDWRNASRDVLKTHPYHIGGGLIWIGVFLILRKLSAPLCGTTNENYHRELVLHIPSEDIFSAYRSLNYFSRVLDSMGIKVKYHGGAAPKWYGGCSGFYFDWVQKYQKKEEQGIQKSFKDTQDKTTIIGSMKMFPMVNESTGQNIVWYYRRPCIRTDRRAWK